MLCKSSLWKRVKKAQLTEWKYILSFCLPGKLTSDEQQTDCENVSEWSGPLNRGCVVAASLSAFPQSLSLHRSVSFTTWRQAEPSTQVANWPLKTTRWGVTFAQRLESASGRQASTTLEWCVVYRPEVSVSALFACSSSMNYKCTEVEGHSPGK